MKTMPSSPMEKQSKVHSLAVAIPLALAATGALAGVFGTLPEPTVREDGKKVYTLGASTSTAEATYDKATAYDYIDWEALNVPEGSVVKFNGAIVLDDLPGGGGYEYDWSGCTRLAMVNGNLVAAGTKVVIPTNVVAFLAYDSTVTKSDDGTAFTLSKPSKCYFYGDVELNGTMTLPGNDLYARMFYGALTGRGNIELNGFWQYLSVFGSCDFDGTVKFGNSQIGQNLHIYSSSPTSHVGTVSTGDYLQQNDKGEWRDAAQYVYFEPKREDATAESSVLVISNLNIRMYQDKELATDSGRRRRRGPQLIAYSNNTIRVESVTGRECPIGLFAESDCNYMVGNPPAFDKGLGNVILGDHGNRNSYYYVSPMMNVTLAGTHGPYGTNAMGFDYRAESNVVNQAEFLDLSGVTSYPNPRSVQIWGYSPANLPSSIRLRYRESQGDGCIPLNLTDSEWTMPFDFGAADANPARCETNCKLVIPSSGTVYVTNATVAADAAYPTEWTEYPVLTTYAGGAPTNDAGESVFNDWEIRLLGDWRKMKVEKVVKDTGLYLRMRKTSGFKIIIR